MRACDYKAVTGLIFVCTLVPYWERVGFSIAFTSVAKETGVTDTEKGSVFAALFSGDALTQVLGGYLASRYGGDLVLAVSYALWTPLSALTSILSSSSDSYIFSMLVCRLAIGMAQGMIAPSSDLVLGCWVPSSQRGRYFSFAGSGRYFGSAVAMATVPIIVSGLGAPATFVIAAILGASWLAVWLCAGPDVYHHAEDVTSERSITAGDAAVAAAAASTGGGVGGQSMSETGYVSRTHQRGAGLEPSDSGIADKPNHFPTTACHTRPSVEDLGERGGAGRLETVHRTSTPAIPSDAKLKVHLLAWTDPELLYREHPELGRAGDEGWAVAAGASQTTPTKAGEEENEEGGDGNDNLLGRMEVGYSSFTDGAWRNKVGKRWSAAQEPTGRGETLSNTSSTSNISRCHGQGLLTRTTSSGSDGRMRGDGDDSMDGRWSCVIRDVYTGSSGTLGNTGSKSQTSIASSITNSMSSSSVSSISSVSSKSSRPVAVGRGREGVTGSKMTPSETTPIFPGGGSPVEPTATGKTRTPAMTQGRQQAKKGFSKVPWKAMGTSPAAWACAAANIGATVGVNVVTIWLPTYFEELFRVDLRDLGVVTLMTPYLTMAVFSILGGNLFGWLTNTRGISTSRAFKLITGISFACAIIFLLCMGLATSPTMGTVLSSLALASMALSRGGWSTYHVEISSLDHSAMLYSAANTSSSVASVGAIAVTGKLLDYLGGAGQAWAWVVAMGAVGAMCGACGIFFLVFSEGDEILFPSTVASAGGKYATVVAAATAAGEKPGGCKEVSYSSTEERSMLANTAV